MERVGRGQRDSVPGLLDRVPAGRGGLPWSLEMGAAVQFGPRPLNPRWIAPSRYNVPRALDMRRERLRRERDYAALIERARMRGDSDLAEALRVQMRQDRLRDARELRAFEAATRALMKQAYHSLPRRYLLVSTALDIRGGTRARDRGEQRAPAAMVGLWALARRPTVAACRRARRLRALPRLGRCDQRLVLGRSGDRKRA